MIAAVAIGLPLGQLLRHYFLEFVYCDVIALAAATWTAAILSLYYARITAKPLYRSLETSSHKHLYSKLACDYTYHSYTDPDKDPLLSQDELSIMYANINALRAEERYKINPNTHPGLEIKSVLSKAIKNYRNADVPWSGFATQAFPETLEIMEHTLSAFEGGRVIVECVPMAVMSIPHVKAISYACNGHLRIMMGCEMMDVTQPQSSISIFCETTSELLVHAASGTFLSRDIIHTA